MITLEHEICHLIVNLWCRSKDDAHGSHFQTLVQNIFGHTDSNHSLGRGLSEDPEIHLVKVRAYLKPGLRVRLYDPWDMQVTEYQVVNPNYSPQEFVAYSPEDDQYYPRNFLDVLLPEEAV